MRRLGGYAKEVTPSDTATLDQCATIYVGGAGNIAVKTADGDEVTFVGVLKGTILPVLILQVKATGTTATNMLATY